MSLESVLCKEPDEQVGVVVGLPTADATDIMIRSSISMGVTPTLAFQQPATYRADFWWCRQVGLLCEWHFQKSKSWNEQRDSSAMTHKLCKWELFTNSFRFLRSLIFPLQIVMCMFSLQKQIWYSFEWRSYRRDYRPFQGITLLYVGHLEIGTVQCSGWVGEIVMLFLSAHLADVA